MLPQLFVNYKVSFTLKLLIHKIQIHKIEVTDSQESVTHAICVINAHITT